MLFVSRRRPASQLRPAARPGRGQPLTEALAKAGDGDILRLEAGEHAGPAVIAKRGIRLEGLPGAIIDGGGQGQVIRVAAPEAVIRGLVIRNSGENFDSVDAAVFVGRDLANVRIEDNRIENNLFGVYLHGPKAAVVRNNVIIGRQSRRMNDRGNGVHIWNSPGSVIENNDFRYGRDGIFVTTSEGNIFRGNRFRDLRFAIHYMYTNDAEVVGNISQGNHLGYALMYSHRLLVRGNVSENDRDHGFAFNFGNESVLAENIVRNRFEGCEIGIHFTAGSERNRIHGNAFIANRTQVKYVGSRWLDWSHDGRGNYWSDNTAFDLDGDGISDTPYKPNDLVDQIVWRHPTAKLLLTSPAVQVLRWAQESFPGLHPGGVTDSAPLMQPPEIDANAWRRSP